MKRHNRAMRKNAALHPGIVLVLLSALMVCMSSYLVTPPAHALFDGEGRHVTGVGAESVGGFWLGAYAPPGNAERRYPIWCTHMWRANPQPSDSARIDTLSESAMWGPDELDLTTAQMAWLLHEHQGNVEADNRAVLSFLIHANFEREQAGRSTQDSVNRLVQAVKTQLPEVYQRAKRYVEDARHSAVVGYESGLVDGENLREGRLYHLGVMNDAGHWIAGRPIKVHLEGAAVFTENGQADWEGITGEEALSLAWKSTGNGQVKAVVTFPHAVRTTLSVYGVKGKQDTLSYGDRPLEDAEERVIPGPQWNVLYDFQPVATTRVAEANVEGGTLRDLVSAAADPQYGDGQWPEVGGEKIPVLFEGSAYYVGDRAPEEGGNIPEGAREIGTTTLTFRGPGTQEARLDIPDLPSGFVTWVWKVRRDQQGEYRDYIHSDWTDRYGQEQETSLNPFRVQIHTSASPRHTRGGIYLVDDLFISGFPEDHPSWGGKGGVPGDEGEMTHALYFFPVGLSLDEAHLAQAEKVGEVRVPARNGAVTGLGAMNFRLREGAQGTYVFVTEFSGDGRVAPYRSPVNDPDEQYVPTPAASPSESPSPSTPPVPPPAPVVSLPPASPTPCQSPTPSESPSPSRPPAPPTPSSPPAPSPSEEPTFSPPPPPFPSKPPVILAHTGLGGMAHLCAMVSGGLLAGGVLMFRKCMSSGRQG